MVTAVALRKGQGQRPGRLHQLPSERVKVRDLDGCTSCPQKGSRSETWTVAPVALRKGQGQRPGRLHQLPSERVKVRDLDGCTSCPQKGSRSETGIVAPVALRKGQGQRLSWLRQLPLQRVKPRYNSPRPETSTITASLWKSPFARVRTRGQQG